MNLKILQPQVQAFITEHLRDDLTKLILKGSPFEGVSIQEIAHQISGKQKAKKKLPTWFSTEKIIYPKNLNLSQSSSETTAKYKANLVQGKQLIDLTGGFGVDSFFFSQKIPETIYCERNQELSEIAEHNYHRLTDENRIQFEHTDGIDFLQKNQQNFDWIYLDPSRRSESGKKLFRLEDCEPNIVENLALLLKKGKNIFLKTSPLLDVSLGISLLKNVQEIHIIAVSNDVKELLWILSVEKSIQKIPIKTVHFKNGKKEIFSGNLVEEQQASASISEPLSFLYEPNAAIMKSGLFNSLSANFKLPKLHQNTHLFTSEKLVDFPGRIFKISKILPFKPKNLKRKIGMEKTNISVRNFPKSVAQLKKTFGLKDGGETYLFFTTNYNQQKIVLVCEKISGFSAS